MIKFIIKSKLLKISLVSLIAVGSASGVYLTYHPNVPVAGATAEVPQVSQLSGQELPLVVKPELVQTPEQIVEKKIDELVIDRKVAIASLDNPSRSQTGAVLGQVLAQNGKSQGQPAAPGETKSQEQPSSQAANSKYDTTLNSYVLDVIKTYPIGAYPYLLNNDYTNYNGVTVNISYQDKLLLKAHPSGRRYSHCSGITFEVFFKAMQQRNKKLGLSPDNFNGMSYDQLHDFVMSWYVADGNKQIQNVARAVEKYGIGRRITSLEEARAGDFMDISRENNTGHTVVFIKWLRNDAGRIIGLKYWSSQESTNGISYKEEYFNIPNEAGQKYGKVMINNVYIARVSPVKDYRNF